MTATRKSPPPIVFILLGCLTLFSVSQVPQFLKFPTASQSSNVSDRMSSGEKSLISDQMTPEKLAGVQSMAQNNFSQAIVHFEQSLQKQPNDPEVRIYLNNAKAAQAEHHKLAVVVPIGHDLPMSQEVLRGVAQAQQEINDAGGINGKQVFIVIANDDENPNTGKQIAQDFVNRSDILGVIGHTASDVTIASAKTYDAGKLVAISPISSSIEISNQSRFVFRTIPSDAIAARTLATHALTQNRKKVAVYFNSTSNYSRSLKSEFTKSIQSSGGQVVAEYDLNDSGFTPSRSLDRANGADVIFLAPNTATLDKALQVVQANQNRLPILAGDDMYAAKTLDVVRDRGTGMVVAVPWHILGDLTSSFPERSRKMWNSDVNWRTVMTYDAMQALIAALQQNPTRAGIQETLSRANFSAIGASGTVRFMAGDRDAPVQLVTIVKGERSSYGFDFVPVQKRSN